mgnify:CR=1 FL=1
MTFGEKLFKLRKEKGLSQEQLAWQVNTTRQAVSKWENDQGFPETEKLMMLGNIFSVSIDYLLKNGGEAHSPAADGYYVSREKAQSWLSHESRLAPQHKLPCVFRYSIFPSGQHPCRDIELCGNGSAGAGQHVCCLPDRPRL